MRRSIPALFLFLALACGETEPANQPPIGAQDLVDHDLLFHTDSTISLEPYFEDPDSDPLTFFAQSSEPATAEASVSGNMLTLRTERSAGSARVEVGAMDPDSAMATQTFTVSVVNRPPSAADTIPDHILGVRRDSTIQLSLYFTDPDGDTLAYEAVTRGGTVEASVDGSLLTMTAGRASDTEVEVTATDPDDAKATQVFAVTVVNQPPVVARLIPSHRLGAHKDSVIDLDTYFDDPNGDTLAYAVTSTDPASVGVSVAGSMLTMSAGQGGGSEIEVTARDPDGAHVLQAFDVTVLSTSWEEKFDSAEALDGWERHEPNGASIEVDEDNGLLVLNAPDDFEDWTWIRNYELVSIDRNWEFSTRWRWKSGPELCPSIEIATGGDRYSEWQFEIDHWAGSWIIYVKETGGRWEAVVEDYFDDPPEEGGDPFNIAVSLVADTMMVTMDADTLIRSHAKDLDDWPNQNHDPPRAALGVKFLLDPCYSTGTITFDWAKLQEIR